MTTDNAYSTTVMERLKDISQSSINKLIQPFLEKPHSKVTWQVYGKWRTFTHINGKVTLRRYRQQPIGAKVVKSAREDTEYAQERWEVEVDRRGRLPVATPILRQPVYLGNGRPF